MGVNPRVNLISSDKIISTLSFDQLQLMNSSIEYTKPISAPIKKGDELGKLIIDIDGKPKIEIPLIAEKDVSEINPLFKVFAAAKYLIFGRSLDEIK